MAGHGRVDVPCSNSVGLEFSVSERIAARAIYMPPADERIKDQQDEFFTFARSWILINRVSRSGGRLAMINSHRTLAMVEVDGTGRGRAL